MFTSNRNGFYAAAVVASLLASIATADESNVLAIDHDVIIIDGAYFPPLIHAQVGDRLIFENASSGVHVVQGPEDTWTSGPIPVEGTFTLTLTPETPLTFVASVETEGDSAEEGDNLLEQIGEITYEPAPIDG